jgi:hypothetical protein
MQNNCQYFAARVFAEVNDDDHVDSRQEGGGQSEERGDEHDDAKDGHIEGRHEAGGQIEVPGDGHDDVEDGHIEGRHEGVGQSQEPGDDHDDVEELVTISSITISAKKKFQGKFLP